MNMGFLVLGLGLALSVLMVASSDMSKLVTQRALAAAEAERVAAAVSVECSRGTGCAGAAPACSPSNSRRWLAVARGGAVEVVVTREWSPSFFRGWDSVVHVETASLSTPGFGQWECPV